MTEIKTPLIIESERGNISCVWQAAEINELRTAVLFIGGADGGFMGPSDIYEALSKLFIPLQIGVLRVDYRIHQFPNDVEQGAYDAQQAASWLMSQGYEKILIVGHSFGGAVAIETAAKNHNIRGVIGLASQTAGATNITSLVDTPVLLIHGDSDTRLPVSCSIMLYEMTSTPCELAILEGGTHSLRQVSESATKLILDFVKNHI
jgi:pimeloyl-ACP methyl ester carboxylesterase